MVGAPGRVTITTSAIKVDETSISHMFAAHEISPGRYVCLEVAKHGLRHERRDEGKESSNVVLSI